MSRIITYYMIETIRFRKTFELPDDLALSEDEDDRIDQVDDACREDWSNTSNWADCYEECTDATMEVDEYPPGDHPLVAEVRKARANFKEEI
jgi:hypothetical protein